MPENLCLQWKDFKENVHSAFGRLREDKELTDVTLACEDGQQMEVHKVILAASSPFFGEIFSRNRHPHPLIYLRGFKSVDLVAILDFIYCGKSRVFQENLNSFLAIAEELKLKGLAIQSFSDVLKEEKTPSNPKPLENSIQQEPLNNSIQEEPLIDSIQQEVKLKGLTTRSFSDVLKEEETLSNPKTFDNPNEFFMTSTAYSVKDDFVQDVKDFEKVPTTLVQELDKKVKSMMEKSQNTFQSGKQANGATMRGKTSICKLCGKEGMTTTIRNHIEANHLEGISIPCDRCDKAFTSRVALTMHKGRSHR